MRPDAAVEHHPVERDILRLDREKIMREYWDQDEFVFIPDCLSARGLAPLAEDARRLTPRVNRNYIPGHKKGGSVSAFTIAEDGPALARFYRSEVFLNFLQEVVKAELKLSPVDDPHACALYYYTEPGDHIGFHYDTSYYKGARYTVLVGLVNDSTSRLLCRLHTRRKGATPVDLSVSTKPGSMVIFNGDKVYHAVSPCQQGECRIILTMEYVTNQEMGPFKRAFSNLKDAFAYFGVRSLWQSRKMSR